MGKLLLLAVYLLLIKLYIKLSSCEYEDHSSLEFQVVKRVAETKSIKIRKYNRKKRKNKYRTKKITKKNRKIKRTKKNRKIKRTKKNRKKTIKKDSKSKRNQGRLVDDKCLGSATIKENENNQKDGAATESSSNRERINRIFSC